MHLLSLWSVPFFPYIHLLFAIVVLFVALNFPGIGARDGAWCMCVRSCFRSPSFSARALAHGWGRRWSTMLSAANVPVLFGIWPFLDFMLWMGPGV